MLLIDGTFSFATPFCACIFNKHSNALHFILEPGTFWIPKIEEANAKLLAKIN
jgi:hypothetical protein